MSGCQSQSELLRRIDDCYREQSWFTRLYAYWRTRYYPLDTYLQYLPQEGTIADVGCGRGVLTCLLAILRPQGTVIGYEPDARRARVANQIAGRLQNVSFRACGWEEMGTGNFNAIVLIDTLHHVPYAEHQALLQALARQLVPGGVLLINETDPSTPHRYRFWWNYLSDVLLYPASSRCFFESPETMMTMVRQAGLTVSTHPLASTFGFATLLYVCTKPLTSSCAA